MKQYRYTQIFDYNTSGLNLMVTITLPEARTHKNEKEALKSAASSGMFFLTPTRGVFCSAKSTVVFDDPSEYLTVEKMKNEKILQTGKPLSPEDISTLNQKGVLESVVFSNNYCITPDDYEEIAFNAGELFENLRQHSTPQSRYVGADLEREVFVFENIAYGVKECD